MIRHGAIQNAYQGLGREATFYDGMITCSTLPGRVVCALVWNGENRRTDWFVEKRYTSKGFFTPPYETSESLRQRLERQYQRATVETVESMACFICRKDGNKK